MTLEDRVTKDSVFYIHSIDYNSVNQQLIIKFLGDPQHQQEVVRLLTFQNIQNFVDQLDIDNFDEDCLDSLVGLQEFPKSNGVEYIILTEQREIRFLTRVEPNIQEYPALHS